MSKLKSLDTVCYKYISFLKKRKKKITFVNDSLFACTLYILYIYTRRVNTFYIF